MNGWTEHLRCLKCGKTGDAELFEISQFNNDFRKVPEGFKVVVGEFGSEFYCASCEIPSLTMKRPPQLAAYSYEPVHAFKKTKAAAMFSLRPRVSKDIRVKKI